MRRNVVVVVMAMTRSDTHQGVPWVFELISTMVGHYYNEYNECQPDIVRVIIFITDLFVYFAVSENSPI